MKEGSALRRRSAESRPEGEDVVHGRNDVGMKLIAASLLLLAAAGAPACTTFVVGRKASETGRVIVGHNEDDGGKLVVRHGYVPAREWGPHEFLPCEDGRASLPQAPRTFGFFWSEVKSPAGGPSNADTMYNEKGVLVLSNGAGGCVDCGKDGLTDGGIEYNVRRAVAERAASAREAVSVITNLVSKWGYASPNGRIYTVADKDEAFIVELAFGRSYAARRCPDDEVAVIPNCYTVRTLWPGDIVSPDLVGRPSDFDFARTFQLPAIFKREKDTKRQAHACRALTGRDWPAGDYPFSVKPSRTIGAAELKDLLRHSYISCTVEQSVWVFADDPRGMAAEIAPQSKDGPKHRRISPLGALPGDMCAKDAAGRLERHLLPEPKEGEAK